MARRKRRAKRRRFGSSSEVHAAEVDKQIRRFKSELGVAAKALRTSPRGRSAYGCRHAYPFLLEAKAAAARAYSEASHAGVLSPMPRKLVKVGKQMQKAASLFNDRCVIHLQAMPKRRK
jgi:hypothetical protein